MKRFFTIFFAASFIAATIIGGSFYVAATKWRSKTAIELEIAQGSSVRKIADELAKAGVIGTPKLMEIYARLKGVSGKLAAGAYEFPAGTNMLAVLSKLERGDVKKYPFTVIEGWTIKDIAKALEGKPFIANPAVPNEFTRLATDKGFIAQLGFGSLQSLEGYLFPDTYFVTKPLTAEGLVKRLTARFREVANSIGISAVVKDGMSEAEIVTLASIVEKETGAKDERPVIASVFLNRLKLGMPLQSDPTIIYGLPDFDGNIRREDISNPHAYNTYVHPDLPPGPICNPGKASLDAILRPAETKYLYFVSRNDGRHVFTETLAEHSRAVERYQVQRSRDK